MFGDALYFLHKHFRLVFFGTPALVLIALVGLTAGGLRKESPQPTLALANVGNLVGGPTSLKSPIGITL